MPGSHTQDTRDYPGGGGGGSCLCPRGIKSGSTVTASLLFLFLFCRIPFLRPFLFRQGGTL